MLLTLRGHESVTKVAWNPDRKRLAIRLTGGIVTIGAVPMANCCVDGMRGVRCARQRFKSGIAV